MTKIIIGCDPDVDGKGFAIYKNCKLEQLLTLSIVGFYIYIDKILTNCDECKIELHIEDLHSNKGFWKKGGSGSARKVGRCEQMQLEFEKVAEYFDIKIVRHPVSSTWKSQLQKKEFERVTGWAGSSNEDSRSAAYFGYLGVITGKTT